jgi:PAS domain S-box-containing protein
MTNAGRREPPDEFPGPGGLRPSAPLDRGALVSARAAAGVLSEPIRLYQLLVESVRDYAIFVLDPDGHILSWNQGAERIKGYAPEEVLGHHFSIFYPPDAIEAGTPARGLETAAEVGQHEDEGWRVRKDGSRFWANVVITALRDEGGDLVGFAKVTRDLTERRATQERAIAEARRAAAATAANRAKSEFLATMSHELRTPLNAIGGYAELIEMGLVGPVTEQQRQYLDRIRRSQQHLLAMVSDLLNFSRIDAGQVSYEIGPVAVAAAVDTVLPLVEPQAAAKGVALERGPCPPDVVGSADRSKVEQILLNVLSNAVKFTPSGGRITVSCSPAGDRVALVVADTGIGIAPDKLESIFEPFVQLGRSLSTSHEGTGLGLAISRDLARAMGGGLTAESVVGGGSTFTLTLPRG